MLCRAYKQMAIFTRVADRRNLVACVFTALSGIFVSAILHSGNGPNQLYSDIWSFWGRPWVVSGQVPYSSPAAFLEYPPVSGAVLYAARSIGGDLASWFGSTYSGYYGVFSALSLLAAAGIGWSTWRLAKALGARLNPLYFILPTMLVYGVYNFDLFNALFIVLGLQLFVEKRRNLSAASIGLAIATKLVAGVLVPIFLLELSGWKQRGRYLAISAGVAAATLIPVALFNFGYFSQFFSFYSAWGLEDAWYIWIFINQFSTTAKVFGLVLMAVLLLKVYATKMPLVERSFLALASYLFATTIYAPQFNVMLIPIIAVLGSESAWLYSLEASNALIILTWFTVPDPTRAWTVPQVFALVRTASLGLLALTVASDAGHSVTSWLGSHLKLPLGTGRGALRARGDEPPIPG